VEFGRPKHTLLIYTSTSTRHFTGIFFHSPLFFDSEPARHGAGARAICQAKPALQLLFTSIQAA
jgi:hypothetical protein